MAAAAETWPSLLQWQKVAWVTQPNGKGLNQKPHPPRGRGCPDCPSLLQNVGCDFEIDSYAVEDRCGVCRGDGSTCQTVTKTFEEREGLGEPVLPPLWRGGGRS